MKFIQTADWHLRKNKPRCRLDSDWMETQRNQIRFIIEEANKRACPIIHCGDIFDTAKVEPEVLNMLLNELRYLHTSFHWIPGNHDLYYHSMDLLNMSSIYALTNWAGVSFFLPDSIQNGEFGEEVDLMDATPFNEEPKENEIMFIHQLVFNSEKDIPPGSDGISAKDLLSKYPKAEMIFTGDNHKSFIYKEPKSQRLVINPGCMNRQTADLKGYKPICYYVDLSENITVSRIEIPDEAEMVTDEYLRKEEAREDRIEAFIEVIREKGEVSLSFVDNLREVLKEKSIEKEVKDTVSIICKEAGVSL